MQGPIAALPEFATAVTRHWGAGLMAFGGVIGWIIDIQSSTGESGPRPTPATAAA
jgi:hypothetical protein